jgi:hypothetical protein
MVWLVFLLDGSSVCRRWPEYEQIGFDLQITLVHEFEFDP